MTSATLVQYEALEDGRPLTALLPRRELESALAAGGSTQLWFEVGREEDEETRKLTVDLESTDLEKILGLSTGDQVALVLDGGTLTDMFEEPDVEAHGLRGALAIAVAAAAAAAAAPAAGLAASSPQTADLASTAQAASVASTAQSATAASEPQRRRLSATAQRAAAAATAQRKRASATTQVSSSLVLKANGVRLLKRLR